MEKKIKYEERKNSIKELIPLLQRLLKTMFFSFKPVSTILTDIQFLIHSYMAAVSQGFALVTFCFQALTPALRTNQCHMISSIILIIQTCFRNPCTHTASCKRERDPHKLGAYFYHFLFSSSYSRTQDKLVSHDLLHNPYPYYCFIFIKSLAFLS